MKAVPVARKLSMTEQGKDQCCLFQRGDNSDEGHNPEKLSWTPSPDKVSVARELSTIERRKERNCFGEEIIGSLVTNPKTVLGFSLGEDVGFRDNNFFYYIQGYVSNDQAYGKLSGNKD
jgi:hypothetical protein